MAVGSGVGVAVGSGVGVGVGVGVAVGVGVNVGVGVGVGLTIRKANTTASVFNLVDNSNAPAPIATPTKKYLLILTRVVYQIYYLPAALKREI